VHHDAFGTGDVIEPTMLDLSGERFTATYDFRGEHTEALGRARALCVEQTIEFPADLVSDDDIRNGVIGHIESEERIDDETTRVVVSYAVETTGHELPQLLNVLWGNSSILPDIRLVDVGLSDSLLATFDGPRFGVAGLRELFDAPDRPLLATALKPMGLSADRLAAEAHELALGGIDIIKDDHSLANQEFAPFDERVRACAAAVAAANEKTGYHSVYMPSVNAPFDQLPDRLSTALDAGAGALLVLPGITGLDHLRYLATTTEVPIMAHPALLGSFSASPTSGIAHHVIYGRLMRLAGADLSVYPNHGGRFSFSPDECRSIAGSLTEPMGALAPALPAPGGGMTLDRVGEIVDFYGPDVALLIGGDLHRGDDLRSRAAQFRAAVER